MSNPVGGMKPTNGKGKNKQRERSRGTVDALSATRDVKKFTMATNLYALSLLFPRDYPGARIPDMNALPSATFTIQYRKTIGADATYGYALGAFGVGGTSASLGSLIPMPLSGGGGFVAGCYSGPGMTLEDIFSGYVNFTFSGWSSTGSTVPTIYQQVRLVSAEARMMFIGSDTTASGKITAAFVPKRQFDSDRGATAVTLDQLESYDMCHTEPIESHKPVIVRYRPVDSQCRYYVPLLAYNDQYAYHPEYFPGCFVMVATGGVPSGLYQIEYYANYEAVPIYSTSTNLSLANSIVDIDALAQGMNEAASAPPVYQGDTDQLADKTELPGVATNPEAPIKQEKTLFDTLLDAAPTILEEGVNKAVELAPALTTAIGLPELAPLASGAAGWLGDKLKGLLEPG